MLDPKISTPAPQHFGPAGASLLEHYRYMSGLVDALINLRPLVSCIRTPVVIPRSGVKGAIAQDRLQALLSAVCAALGMIAPLLQEIDDELMSLSEYVIHQRLDELLAGIEEPALRASAGFDALLEQIPLYVREYEAAVHYEAIMVGRLLSSDGTPLTTYRSVGAREHTVVMVLPCAMPFQIARTWFAFLSQFYNVITWETRRILDGGSGDEPDPRLDLDAQSDDLLSVIRQHCTVPPHVMGICGGAVVAINAAQRAQARFAGLSLWYGDYNFNEPSLQTDYQKNLRWMMETAAAGRDSAQIVFDLFNDKAMLKSLHVRYATSILCPYADVDNLQRYALLNGAIMSADIAEIATRLPMFISVISSESDQTAHPGGSRRLAELLASSELHMEREGDHLSFFDARPNNRMIALACIRKSFPVHGTDISNVEHYVA
jgi:pimeloyl-ACP methyl ester carboxylesterase